MELKTPVMLQIGGFNSIIPSQTFQILQIMVEAQIWGWEKEIYFPTYRVVDFATAESHTWSVLYFEETTGRKSLRWPEPWLFWP